MHRYCGGTCVVSRTWTAGRGGASRDRTGDLLLAKQALSQLSYGPSSDPPGMVGLGRFELPASPLSGARSDQLSYKPELLHGQAADGQGPGPMSQAIARWTGWTGTPLVSWLFNTYQTACRIPIGPAPAV